MAFLVVHPELAVADQAAASIVFDPARLIDPRVVEQYPVVDAAVRSSQKPVLLLAAIHRRADLQDAMRKRSGVNIAGPIIKVSDQSIQRSRGIAGCYYNSSRPGITASNRPSTLQRTGIVTHLAELPDDLRVNKLCQFRRHACVLSNPSYRGCGPVDHAQIIPVRRIGRRQRFLPLEAYSEIRWPDDCKHS
jgi:hypothetical protein